MKEERRVRYPFDDSNLHWCPVYNNEWVQVNKLAKIIPGVTLNELMERWNDLIQERIPNTRTGKARHFIHFDRLAEALGMCSTLDQNLIEQAVDSLKKEERHNPDIPVRKRSAYSRDQSPILLESDDVVEMHLVRKKKKNTQEEDMPEWGRKLMQTMQGIITGKAMEEYRQTEEFTRRCEEEIRIRSSIRMELEQCLNDVAGGQ